MSLIKTANELRQKINYKKTVGFVPTMGYLHEGHLSLIKKAKSENEIVVVSIFVNPAQFAPDEDFEDYPRDIERDYKMAVKAGADIVFNPEINEIYKKGASTYIQVEGNITSKLCGQSRPAHFKGVTTVVNILFNIVSANNAYFGQKDAQQAIIVKKMVKDLHMNINIVICPVVREPDGLAMSSRNIYLSNEERVQARIINQALQMVYKRFVEGEKDVNTLKKNITELIKEKSLAKIDYVEILDGNTLEKIDQIERQALVAIKVRFGKTRLIDNIVLG